MTSNEFLMGVELLQRTYGEAKYSQERVKVLHEKFAGTDKAVWVMACKDMIANESYPPLESKMRTYIEARQRKRQQEHIQGEDTSCPLCQGTGAVTVVALEENEFGYKPEVVFQCNNCQNGPRFCCGMPKWHRSFLKEYNFKHSDTLELDVLSDVKDYLRGDFE